MSALDGIKVIEFGDGVAVGYCGALLVACGAEVIKVEPPKIGDSARYLPPFAEYGTAPESSGLNAFLSAGKSSVVLDLTTPDGAGAAQQLASGADIVLEAMGPGNADALGLGFKTLSIHNPQLIMAALSWFGNDGARRDWAASDAVVQALAGFIYPIGQAEGPPIIPGGYNAQITGGLTAFIAVTAALIGRHTGDDGVLIDQSILEAQTAYTESAGVRVAYDGPPSVRKGINKFTPTFPQTIYPASDGWIGVTALTPAQWRSCCDLVGAPELFNDPRFRSSEERSNNADTLDDLLIPLFAKRPALEWFHDAQARRVPFALVPTMAELATLDHFQERGVVARFEHPDLGVFSAPVIPWKLAGTPLKQGGVAPRLGQHTKHVLGSFNDQETVQRDNPKGNPHTEGPSPLRDVRIVDLTMGWSGPLATRHLADMGAEVVKIEACQHPDWWRGWEHTAESLATQAHEKSPTFNQVNRNKLGVAINLTQPEGRALVLKLVARADAVIENQATGVMAKLGLSFEELKSVNPDIIMLSLPAFGAVGPWSGYRGYGSTVEHGAGLPYLTGDPDGPPIQTHVAYGDACGGMNAAAALLVALFHRKRTGKGQRIEISQVECMLQLGVHGGIAQGLNGAPPTRTGNRHPVFTPHGCFACAESDTWLVLALTEDSQWPALCNVIGQPGLGTDAALATADGRRARQDDIEGAITEWCDGVDAGVAMEAMQQAGVPAGTVRRPTELLHDPAYVERGFWLEMDRAHVGPKPHPLTPWRMNGQRGPIRAPAPLLGEHNRMVLHDILGMTDDEIADLEASRIIGDQPIAS